MGFLDFVDVDSKVALTLRRPITRKPTTMATSLESFGWVIENSRFRTRPVNAHHGRVASPLKSKKARRLLRQASLILLLPKETNENKWWTN